MALDSVIEKYARSPGGIDLFDLVQEINSTSIHGLLQKITEYGNKHSVAVDAVFHLKQAEEIWRELSDTVQTGELVGLLCQKLSVLQTGNVVGKYCNDQSFHRHFCTKADVVMFGDSITEYTHWHEIFPDVKILNRGIAGDITRGMLSRIDTVVDARPEKVFILAGINDISLGYDVEGVLQRYEKILDAFIENAIKPFVQSTLYVGERLKGLNVAVKELNQGLIEVCRQKGLSFIDVADVLCPMGILPEEHSYDDLHLNGVAYDKWGQTIAPLIN